MNLGAIDTTWSAPSACATDSASPLLSFTNTDSLVEALPTDTSYYVQGPTYFSSCFPPGYNTKVGAYYSGSKCPNGYTTACIGNIALLSGSPQSVTEKAVTCCPSIGTRTFACLTSTALAPWETALGCVSSSPPHASTVAGVGTTTQTPAVVTPMLVYAHSIEVRYQYQPEPPPQIPVPAIAGIVLGIAIVFWLLFLWFNRGYQRRRKARKQERAASAAAVDHGLGAPVAPNVNPAPDGIIR